MSSSIKSCSVCGKNFGPNEAFCSSDGTPLQVASTGSGAGLQGEGNSATRDPLIGQTLGGRYHVLQVIGEGGMGIVYEAMHVLIERRVAVKVLRQDFTRKPDVVERFRQEARSASRIGHPNIIDVIDFGQTPSGASYFVMEKLEGEDLAEILSRDCVLAPARAVHLVHQCCVALAAAHAKGIIHRDLKPENLFIGRTPLGAESIKIVDFGVAKMTEPGVTAGRGRRLTRTGMLFGTPEYMSPEQAKGVQPDHRADIYALGIILYELITGRVPFEGNNFMEVLNRHAQDTLPPMVKVNSGVTVSQELELVVQTALAKDREDRFPSMAEMATALEATLEMPSRVSSDGPPSWALAPPKTLPEPTEGLESHVPETRSQRRTTNDPNWARASHPSMGSGRRNLAVGALVAAAALGTVSVYFPGIFGGATTGEPVPAKPPVLATAVAHEAAKDPASNTNSGVPGERAGATPAEQAESVVKSDTYTMRLSSRPAGARVTMDGIGELCDRTPCTADLHRAVPALLRFKLNGTRIQVRVVPEKDEQRVHVNLSRRAAFGADKEAEGNPLVAAEDADSSALKVPAAFR